MVAITIIILLAARLAFSIGTASSIRMQS